MKNLKTMLVFGVLMNKYRKEIVAVNPPDFLVKSAGKIARFLGMDYDI
jgi:hypothetical protein